MRPVILMIMLLQSTLMRAQGYMTYDNFSTSKLCNESGENFGSGDMTMISAGYSVPPHAKINERKQHKFSP